MAGDHEPERESGKQSTAENQSLREVEHGLFYFEGCGGLHAKRGALNAIRLGPVRFLELYELARSRNLADSERAVVPAACQGRGLGIGDDHPVHAKLRFKPLEIFGFEVRPSSSRGNLFVPCGGEGWHLRDHRGVLVGIG